MLLLDTSREIAEAHPKDRFGWMQNAAELFAILESTYRLFTGDAKRMTLPETFPNVIARALAGCSLPARNKRTDRRKLLENAGMDVQQFIQHRYSRLPPYVL